MEILKQFEIKTDLSNEEFFFLYDKPLLPEEQAEKFLAEICFCDAYEIVSIRNATKGEIEKYNIGIKKLAEENIKLDSFWKNNVCLYVKGYYETVQEMIAENI